MKLKEYVELFPFWGNFRKIGDFTVTDTHCDSKSNTITITASHGDFDNSNDLHTNPVTVDETFISVGEMLDIFNECIEELEEL